MKKILLLSVLMFSATCMWAQSYKPGIKLQKGQQYEVTTTVNGTMTQMGMDLPIESSMLSLVEVKDQSPNGYTLRTMNKHFTFKSNMAGEQMNYDSDNKDDADGPVGSMFKDVTGKPDSFMVDNKGYIKASPEKPAVKKDGKKEDNIMGMMMSSAIGNSGSGTPMLNQLPLFKELKAGDHLTDSAENNDDGKQKIVTTYTVTEIKEGQVKINIEAVAKIEKVMDVQQMGMNMSITMKSTNTSKGEMLIDQATGLLISKKIVTDTDGNASVSGMELPITGTSTSEIKVKLL
ncbi:MAG: DUF6263 family protein [Ferruginibacter sp.]